jgi:hypothetical protein
MSDQKRAGTYAGAEWVEENIRAKGEPVVMSSIGRKAADLLGELFEGIYHLNHKMLMKTDWSNNLWIKVSISYTTLSTVDFNKLTMLVFLAHHLALRVTVEAGARKHLWITFHERKRGGTFFENHPTLDQAVEHFKSFVSLEEQK